MNPASDHPRGPGSSASARLATRRRVWDSEGTRKARGSNLKDIESDPNA